ncbi:MAG TPA: site-specific integrase [Acidobacteriaceae bacterium]
MVTPSVTTTATKAPSVRIKRKVKLDGKWTFATIAKRGERVLWDYVLVNDQPQKVEGGSFFLEWVRDGRKIQKSLSSLDPVSAIDAKAAQEATLALQCQGLAGEDAVIPALGGERSLRDTFKAFLEEKRHTINQRSFDKYERNLERFFQNTSKRYASQVTREDIISHIQYLLGACDLDSQTAKSDTIVVLTACRWGGAQIKLNRRDWPRVDEKDVEVYAIEDLKDFFAATTEDERVIFKTFLLSGFRDQEVQYLTWPDVDLRKGTLSVKGKIGPLDANGKPKWSFKPKTREERTVPIPQELVELLKAHREKQAKGTLLVFPTRTSTRTGDEKPNRRFLPQTKQIAFRAGLNCGRCYGWLRGPRKGKKYTRKKVQCCDGPTCSEWRVHRFRATYITELLRSGVDIRTVQALAGHKSLASTMKYLRPLEDARLTVQIERSSLTGL